ncbi:hypothetical protein [Thermaerobacillus caldiproteolyticus]|uniref:hypothetical protein n=1 Tax=Thermaerobacillus caldiproteolyticus TaxID=247480 RepID=UPI00188D75E9|nr:hypothetical protein [Anoxybacillus caldiproteolyticus]QPA31614.1 hypothetical protein ISX45_00895 [Anoxybacillus caldiproteolyticus]
MKLGVLSNPWQHTNSLFNFIPSLFQKVSSVSITPTSITAGLSEWDKSEDLSIYKNYNKQIELLDSIYVFSDYMSVSTFLKKNSFLLELLFEAFLRIRHIFGSNVQLSLSVDKNDGDEGKLYLLIKSKKDPGLLYTLLDKLDETWWFNNLHRAKSKMNIDLEF